MSSDDQASAGKGASAPEEPRRQTMGQLLAIEVKIKQGQRREPDRGIAA